MEKLKVSERRVCRLLGQPRSTQRTKAKIRNDEKALRDEIIKLACQYGRYGYRRITALLRNQGWVVNHKRVERICGKKKDLKCHRSSRGEDVCG